MPNPTTPYVQEIPLSAANGGTGSTAAANAASGVVVLDGSSQLPAVSGALLTNVISSILDYGTSASESTARTLATLKKAYGSFAFAGDGNQAITNLPFTSAATYVVFMSYLYNSTNSWSPVAIKNSGAQFTLYNNNGARTMMWFAIGT